MTKCNHVCKSSLGPGKCADGLTSHNGVKSTVNSKGKKWYSQPRLQDSLQVAGSVVLHVCGVLVVAVVAVV